MKNGRQFVKCVTDLRKGETGVGTTGWDGTWDYVKKED